MQLELSNWGNSPKVKTSVQKVLNVTDMKRNIFQSEHLIVRGTGRSYGDASLNSSLVLDSTDFTDFLHFNIRTGELICEAGITIGKILTYIARTGWFMPVVPGTQFVSLGGAIAANIHGKNHHRSLCLSHYVNWIDMMVANGEIIRCSKTENPLLFYATCGGQGLTGIIIRASIQLVRYESIVIRQKTRVCRTLDETIFRLHFADDGYEFTVGWLDLANKHNKSLIFYGNFITAYEAENSLKLNLRKFERYNNMIEHCPVLDVPFYAPNWLINRMSIGAFNHLYYHKNAHRKDRLTTFNRFFFPLDGITNWNRLYGKKGLIQYQFVVPESELETFTKIISLIQKEHLYSTLAVFKICGYEFPYNGSLTFPKKGYSLALDFKPSTEVYKMLDRFDEMVADAGGHVYLAKDSRLRKPMFYKMYGQRVDEFLQIKSHYDPNNRFTSLLAQRLGLMV